jgi:hypothetical protein
MVMRFGIWNIRTLYRAGSLIPSSREITRYQLDLVGVQEVRWNRGGTASVGIIHFSREGGIKIMN